MFPNCSPKQVCCTLSEHLARHLTDPEQSHEAACQLAGLLDAPAPSPSPCPPAGDKTPTDALPGPKENPDAPSVRRRRVGGRGRHTEEGGSQYVSRNSTSPVMTPLRSSLNVGLLMCA
jgi:hypothetical protein